MLFLIGSARMLESLCNNFRYAYVLRIWSMIGWTNMLLDIAVTCRKTAS